MKDAIPDTHGVIPPPGYVLVENQKGERFWAPPGSLKSSPIRSKLTNDQIHRITACKQMLVEVDDTPLDETLDNYRRDVHPEREIRVYERIARVFQQEVTDRPNAEHAERMLLYRVLLCCSFSPDVDDVLGMLPDAKGLSNLARVVQRYRDAIASRSAE